MSIFRLLLLLTFFLTSLDLIAENEIFANKAKPDLGTDLSKEEVTNLNITILPDGTNLPSGSGTVEIGEKVYLIKCMSCHGLEGKGGPVKIDLVGGIGSLATERPVLTVGSYWPYATTYFDYVRRGMPWNAPQSLTNDEVYALSAYILYKNGIIPVDATINAETLPKVKMPNSDGFINAYQLNLKK